MSCDFSFYDFDNSIWSLNLLRVSLLMWVCWIRYHQMLDWLGRPFRSVPRQPVPPLRVAISRKLKEVVEAKYRSAGAEKGKYIVIHGIKSDSKASMQSKGDPDSLLPIEVWAEIADAIRY